MLTTAMMPSTQSDAKMSCCVGTTVDDDGSVEATMNCGCEGGGGEGGSEHEQVKGQAGSSSTTNGEQAGRQRHNTNLQRGEAEEEGDHDAQACVQVAGGDGEDQQRQAGVAGDDKNAGDDLRVQSAAGGERSAWMACPPHARADALSPNALPHTPTAPQHAART